MGTKTLKEKPKTATPQESPAVGGDLQNFIKYCLGYVKLTREKTAAAQLRHSLELPKEYFDIKGLLNGDTDGSLGEQIKLETFYSYDPKEVPKKEQEQYDTEKEIAIKVDEIYSKYKNDQFTKQIVFNFGFFELELPVEETEAVIQFEELEEETIEEKKPKTKVDRHPLFSLPIRIDKEISKKGVGKYSVYFVDAEIQVNIGILQSALGEDLYFQLLTEIGKYEMEGRLSLPLADLEVFKEIWGQIKAQLRLSQVIFDEQSFQLEEAKIALSPRSNYFLAEDLAKLAQLSEEELSKTSLTSWTANDELNIEGGTPEEKELYFPFPYDKYQLSSLSLLGNKMAIIQGPPGTGKSETISNVLCHLAATGKRVLFVSQKAQALKVVKDKLKKLDVKYLFGYLPNPNSEQIGEEDEADGIAPQLSALGAHIEKLNNKPNSKGYSLDQIVLERQNNSKFLNEAIALQRRAYALHQELLKLKNFDIDITDFKCFEDSFTILDWREIKHTKSEIERIDKLIKKYSRSPERKSFDKLFSAINLTDKEYSDTILKIKEDVAKTGYDRHFKLLRKLNNTTRNLRLSEYRGKLPREIIDYIDSILEKDVSRNEAERDIETLYNYCSYFENVRNLEKFEEKLSQKLSSCGVSDSEFAVIDEKLFSAPSSEWNDVKKQILRVQEIKKEINEIAKAESINKIGLALKRAEVERSRRIGLYIQNIVNKNILSKWKQGITIKQIVRKLATAFGRSRRAFKTFDTLRKDPDNFNAIMDLIPIWIMELDDASRIVPLQAGMFDYVILDEASQCNIAYTLPVMYRTNRVLFVGDSEQMRDSTIMFKSNRVFDELASRYQVPEERQIKATGTAVQSVLDIAYKRGVMDRPLRYHYRSPAELIGFSNENFYTPKGKELIPINSNYLTYKDTDRVMLVHEIKSDWSEEFSDGVNVAEAKAILDLFKNLRDDERYKSKSVGVLTFFNAQATYIRDLFESEGFKEDDDNYKVSIIEGIQGDEKDIVIYSFVIRSLDQRNKYIPLTGEGGDIRGDINKGRVNVAFSRARLQVHCFISMPIEQIPERIWIKKYLEYVRDRGEVAFYSTDLKPFDSYFEEEFFGLLRTNLKRGYKIQNQVESCGFKIDFVVSNTATGKRLAIECDGPCHFKDEIDEAYGIHIESDEERQRVLEAAGWRFCRVKYSDWIDEKFDRSAITNTIIDLLK